MELHRTGPEFLMMVSNFTMPAELRFLLQRMEQFFLQELMIKPNLVNSKNFYGNLVILEHKFTGIEYPVFSLYAHLSAINVDTGDRINLGDKIGEVGASGSAIGSHLHFEVRLNLPNLENRVNPELYLKLINNNQETQTGILVGSIHDNNGQPVPQSDFVLQLIENGQINPNKVYYLETYASEVPSDPKWDENFVISNLPVGRYRISAYIDNQFVEKYIDIVDNSLTDISLSESN